MKSLIISIWESLPISEFFVSKEIKAFNIGSGFFLYKEIAFFNWSIVGYCAAVNKYFKFEFLNSLSYVNDVNIFISILLNTWFSGSVLYFSSNCFNKFDISFISKSFSFKQSLFFNKLKRVSQE